MDAKKQMEFLHRDWEFETKRGKNYFLRKREQIKWHDRIKQRTAWFSIDSLIFYFFLF